MDLEINKKNYKKRKIDSNYLSIWFLIFSIVLTGALYFYNMSLQSNIKDLQTSIETKENSINNLEKQAKIFASSLYDYNKFTINKMEDYSKISMYINHLWNISRKYNIDFKWFKYSNWKLNTEAIASSDSVGINYKKVVKFIKEYRENKDLSALFDLGLVKSVVSKNENVDDIFQISLELKNNIWKILKEKEKKKQELELKKQKELKAKQDLIKEKIKEAKMKKQLENNSSTWSLDSSTWAVEKQ